MRHTIMNDEIKARWIKVLKDIGKYAVGAILGAVGLTVTGCALVPVLDF